MEAVTVLLSVDYLEILFICIAKIYVLFSF